MTMDTVLQVSIKSQRFGSFLSLDGTGVSAWNANGVGSAGAQKVLASWETLQIENHANGTFSILSSRFPGIYLRLDGRDVKEAKPAGVGLANCQYYTEGPARGYELFKFHPQTDGSKTIESVAFPGVFLRVDGTGKGVVNGQWGAKSYERFIVTAL